MQPGAGLVIGTAMGAALGVAFGVAFDNLALGISLGVAIGAGQESRWAPLQPPARSLMTRTIRRKLKNDWNR